MTASTGLPGRIHSLDGLRGVAAVVVLVHHCLLTVPPLADPYLVVDWRPSDNTLANTLILSPLHLVWDGTAAVWIFFILSGIVLTLPVLRTDGFEWISYYPKRLVRLYLPIWVAVALAALNIVIWDRASRGSSSLWLLNAASEVRPEAVAKDITLLRGPGGLASPLWSLQWEIWFSLLLPVYVWVAVAFRRFAVPLAVGALTVIATGRILDVGGLAGGTVRMLPIFAIGTLMAVRFDDLQRLCRPVARSRYGWTILGTFALLSISAPWLIQALSASGPLFQLRTMPALIGCVILVVAAIQWRSLARLLEARLVQYLGTISFSLYLVHEPIVVTTALLFGEDRLAFAIPVAAVMSFLAAHIFYLLVERRAHLLARAVGHRLSADRSASTPV